MLIPAHLGATESQPVGVKLIKHKLGVIFSAIVLTSALAFTGGMPAMAEAEVPITPELIAAADQEALANPLTDAELETIAAQESASLALDPAVPTAELEALSAGLKNGSLTVWINGRQLSTDPNLQESTDAIYVPKTWAACGAFDDAYKNVRTFYLNTVPYTYRAIYLKCGTSGWGYRHIKDAHMSHWAGKAIYVGANWRDMADFAITDALRNVYSGTYNASNRTYKYRGVVQLKRYDGRTVHTFYPVVAVSAGDYRIITAYPSNSR